MLAIFESRTPLHFRHQRDEHLLFQLLTRQEGGQVLQRGADQRAVGQALGAALGLPDLFRVGENLAESRAVQCQHRVHGLLHLGVAVGAVVGVAKRLCKLFKLREGQVAALGADADLAVLLEKVVLRQADRVITVVVDEEDFDRQLVRQDGLQFLQVHHDGAVALEADRLAASAADAGTNGRGQTVAHAGNGAVVCHPAALLDDIRLVTDDTARTVGDRGQAVLRQATA
jgi:hypothetical protein